MVKFGVHIQGFAAKVQALGWDAKLPDYERLKGFAYQGTESSDTAFVEACCEDVHITSLFVELIVGP